MISKENWPCGRCPDASGLDQGSRLSAVRLAESHAACDVLGLRPFNEDDLYGNLAWLSQRQEVIEKRLFRQRYSSVAPQLFLYGVTSSYLEGVQNILAAFGYNRDGKRGKMQLVIGLLTGPEGAPVAVRVFAGNTADTKTVPESRCIGTHPGRQLRGKGDHTAGRPGDAEADLPPGGTE